MELGSNRSAWVFVQIKHAPCCNCVLIGLYDEKTGCWLDVEKHPEVLIHNPIDMAMAVGKYRRTLIENNVITGDRWTDKS